MDGWMVCWVGTLRSGSMFLLVFIHSHIIYNVLFITYHSLS